MTWGAVGSTAVSVVGGMFGKKKNKNAAADAAKAQKKAVEAAWKRSLQANQINKDNQSWAQGVNQASADKALANNRIDQTSDFGSSNWNKDPATGEWTQTSSIAPELQSQLSALRGKYGEGIANLDMDGFGVNDDVMGAMRAQSAPMMEQQRNRENARLAAMGLGTGSGSAWGQSQDALNRSENDMEQKNILGGFSAWQQGQGNTRSNLGAALGLESGWKANAAQTPFQPGQVANAAEVNAPSFGGTGQNDMAAGTNNANNILDANAANMSMWGNIAGGAANTLGNKDVQQGLGNWWSNLGSSGSPVVPGASSGSTGTGFDLGSGIGGNSMSGFYNPWGQK